MRKFDVIVVGSGPAGSAAAHEACRRGLTVALVDRARFPRDKLCGGLITGRSLGLLRDIFGMGEGDPLLYPGGTVSFRWAGAEIACIAPPRPLHFTMRRDFDQKLHASATAAGAETFEASGIEQIGPGAEVLLTGGERLKGRVLIGADGVNSTVARHLFGQSFNRETIGFGLEVESSKKDPDRLVVIDFDAARWGYGWAFPKACGTTFGVGGLLRLNPDLKPALSGMMGADGDARVKGQFIPFGDVRRGPGRGALLLAGDAAGFVDPITGEGIALALESGRLAATAAASALSDGRPSGAITHYRRLLFPLQTELARARRLRWLIFAAPFRTRFRTGLESSPARASVMFELLDGRTTYRALERRAIRRLLGFGRSLVAR